MTDRPPVPSSSPSEHSHVVGGSTAKRRRNCPGSLELEKAEPEPESSPFAVRGTMLHAAVELILTDDPMGFQQSKELARGLIGQDLGFGADHEITDDLVNDKIIPALNAWFRLHREFKFVDWFLETQVSLEEVIPGAFGTADVIAKDKQNRIHVLDWKFGDGVMVPVKENEGTAFYAAGVLYDPDPELREFTENVAEDVYFHIVQPQYSGEALNTWKTTWDWVEDMVDALAESIGLARQPNAPLKVGDWCKWCKAAVTCPAKLDKVGEIIDHETQEVSAEAEAGYSIEQLLEIADVAANWSKAVFAKASEMCEAGTPIQGWKMVEKRATRQYTDPEAVERLLHDKRVPKRKSHNSKLKGPAQLEKEVPKIYANEIESMVVKRSSGLTFVRESNPREAVEHDMSQLANAMESTE